MGVFDAGQHPREWRAPSRRAGSAHHAAVLDVDGCAAAPSFGPRMGCTNCGMIGADARRSK
jgi:hypothetical protein